MQVELIYRPDRFLRGGDHESFLAQDFPVVRFTEAVENFLHQHKEPRVQSGTQYGDLLDYVDFEYTARVARVNLASMWSAANAPAMPRGVSISEVVRFPAGCTNTPLAHLSSLSRFNWTTGNHPLAASYELVWRTTGNPQQTNSLRVAKNTSSVTVDLPKDDLQFGIRAVGVDGKKGPAVFALPVNA